MRSSLKKDSQDSPTKLLKEVKIKEPEKEDKTPSPEKKRSVSPIEKKVLPPKSEPGKISNPIQKG